jgi:hypothetical protein
MDLQNGNLNSTVMEPLACIRLCGEPQVAEVIFFLSEGS